MNAKKKFQIENARSGILLGVYEAEDESSALDAMAQDVGYSDYETVCALVPVQDGEIEVIDVSKCAR